MKPVRNFLSASAATLAFSFAQHASAQESAPAGQTAPAEESAVVTITSKKQFDELLKTDLPVFVEFGAEWCGPCRITAPLIESLAKKRKGEMVFATIDTDKNPDLRDAFGVVGVPLFLKFSEGKPVDICVGGMVAEQFLAAFTDDGTCYKKKPALPGVKK